MTYKLIITQNQMKRFFRKTRNINRDLLKKIVKNFIVQILWNEKAKTSDSPSMKEIQLRSDLFAVTQRTCLQSYYNDPEIFPDAVGKNMKLKFFSCIEYYLICLLDSRKNMGHEVVINIKFSDKELNEGPIYIDVEKPEVA